MCNIHELDVEYEVDIGSQSNIVHITKNRIMTDAENTTIDLGGELQSASITNTNTGYLLNSYDAVSSYGCWY